MYFNIWDLIIFFLGDLDDLVLLIRESLDVLFDWCDVNFFYLLNFVYDVILFYFVFMVIIEVGMIFCIFVLVVLRV